VEDGGEARTLGCDISVTAAVQSALHPVDVHHTGLNGVNVSRIVHPTRRRRRSKHVATICRTLACGNVKEGGIGA
jgi:hypothetical protein